MTGRWGAGLLLLAILPGAAPAQEVADCREAPPVTALVEPWEETSASLGEGAIRLALLRSEGGEGVRLLVLTLPPDPEGEDGADDAQAEPRCRLVTEGGLGFADLDIAGLEVTEDAEAATLTAVLPALGFIPESTELEEQVLLLTFGVGDDSLGAALERP